MKRPAAIVFATVAAHQALQPHHVVQSFVPTCTSCAPASSRHIIRRTNRRHVSKIFMSSISPNGDSFDHQPSNSMMSVTVIDNPNDDDINQQMEAEPDDPLQVVLDNTASLKTNELINIAILLGISFAVVANLLTVDLAGGITRGWTAAEVAYRIPLDDWARYNDILHTFPVFTKAATSATVYAIGDLIAQRTEGTALGEIDRARTVRSLLAGLIGHGPMSHLWYNISENFFDNVAHLTEWWSFIPKVIADQSVFGPIWNNSYLLLLGLMKRDSLSNIWDDMKRTTIPLIVSGLKLWPLVHCVTYGVIPVENRVLWVDAVEIIWVVLLSTQAAGGGEENGEQHALLEKNEQEENNNNDTAMVSR